MGFPLSWSLDIFFFYVLVKSWTFTWRWEIFKAKFDIITSMQSVVLSQPPPPLLFLLRRLEAESASTEHSIRVYGASRLVNFFFVWIRVCTIHSFTPTQVWLPNICMCYSLLGAGGRLWWSCLSRTMLKENLHLHIDPFLLNHQLSCHWGYTLDKSPVHHRANTLGIIDWDPN